MSPVIKTTETYTPTPPVKILKTRAFTLVELIVVITILVILGTIGFMQLSGFQGSARDSSRVSDITNISKGLDMLIIKNSMVMPPENGTNAGVINIIASGTTVGYQGAVGTNLLRAIKMNGEAKDPLDKKSYTYSTNLSYSKYQLLTLFEDSNTSTASIGGLVDQAFAGYETRTPSTKGSQLGILLGNTVANLNQPIQELFNTASFTGVDVVTTNSSYAAVLSTKNTISGTGKSLKRMEISYIHTDKFDLNTLADIANGSLVGYWDMETRTPDGKLKDMSGNRNHGTAGNGAFTIGGFTGKKTGGIATKFEGTNNYIAAGNDPILNTSSKLTYSLWLKRTAVSEYQWPSILGTDFNYHNYYGIRSGSYGNNIYFEYGLPAYTGSFAGTSPGMSLPIGEWHLFTFTYDGSSIVSYKDGAINGTNTNIVLNPNITNIRIGAGLGQTFGGLIDDVRIYNRALSASEIKILYDATK